MKPKFNLFSLINDKKERKKGGINKALTDFDMALFLCAFTAIFGILHYRVLYQPLNVSLWGLILSLIFCAFWVGMAFTGGRYRRKGFWITAAVIWGMALLCTIANLDKFAFLNNLSNTTLATLASYMAFIMLLFVAATVAPLLPGLGAIGYLPATSVELVVLCLIAMAVQAAAFAFGWVFQNKRAEATKLRLRAADRMRQIDTNIDLKD